MENTIVTYPTFNQFFNAWFIRTYIKVHMLLIILLVKAIPIIFFIIRNEQFSTNNILDMVIFFYFEVYICCRYFQYKRNFLKINHHIFIDETLRLEKDESIGKTDLFEHKILWNIISFLHE